MACRGCGSNDVASGQCGTCTNPGVWSTISRVAANLKEANKRTDSYAHTENHGMDGSGPNPYSTNGGGHNGSLFWP